MSVSTSRRARLAAVLATTVAGTTLALVAAPAHAADADDPTFTPVATDLIGVGSDTSQHALKLIADDYNKSVTTGAKVASFAATGGGQITLPSGAINRPNGSGAGKALLYGTGNNADVDFARSSSALSTTEVSAGLQAFPFAVDTLAMAVSNSAASNAPTSLTPAQIVSIYKGDVTNWTQVGGKDGVIKPYIPQAGSGTRSFFVAQLQSMNGGAAVTLGKNVAEAQEHDDTLIKGDANAIAPFSVGRAKLLGTTLRIENTDTKTNGWSAQRALYDVVRGTSVNDATVQAVFGEAGFACSTAARSDIEAAGFEQLATAAHGGVCGQATQGATSNFTTNKQVVTTTALAVTSQKAGKATLTATVTAATAPSGSVTFKEGDTVVAANVPLTSGQAVATVSATPGEHTYTATFTPESGSAFDPSSDEATGTVLAASQLAVSAPKSVVRNKSVAVAKVTLAPATATGTVSVKVGSKTVKASVKNGKATLKLGKLSKTTTFTVVYSGDDTVAGATKKVTVKVTKK